MTFSCITALVFSMLALAEAAALLAFSLALCILSLSLSPSDFAITTTMIIN